MLTLFMHRDAWPSSFVVICRSNRHINNLRPIHTPHVAACRRAATHVDTRNVNGPLGYSKPFYLSSDLYDRDRLCRSSLQWHSLKRHFEVILYDSHISLAIFAKKYGFNPAIERLFLLIQQVQHHGWHFYCFDNALRTNSVRTNDRIITTTQHCV